MKAEQLNNLLKMTDFDSEETKFFVDGFTNGFDINYKGPTNRHDETDNIPFKIGNEKIMWSKIMSEVAEQRYAGPFDRPPYNNYIQSPLGLVPKGKNKVRLIFHLSFDFVEKSVNHHIPHELCTVKYNDIDEAVRMTLNLDQKPIYFGKTDVSNVFRLVPLLPSCKRWLLMKAKDPKDGKWKYFVDKCLPFGSSISCVIFQRFSNAVKHIYVYTMKKQNLIIFVVNYLDNFLFIQISKLLCDEAIKRFLELCEMLGIKIAVEKTEWGMTRIIFLGILLDGDNLVLGIPEEKRNRAIAMLTLFINKKKSTVKEMQRLAGYLNFLTRAILPGRTFTRRMYSKFALKTKSKALKPFHHINLDKEFKADCRTWLTFLSQENTPANIYRPMVDLSSKLIAETLDFYTDASGSLDNGGFGCVFEQNWSWGIWGSEFMNNNEPSIEYLELAALMFGVFIWSEKLRN